MRGIEKTSKEAVKSIEEKVENGIEENK